LFSGQDAFATVLKDAPALRLSTLALLLLFKGLAWSISLGNFRGGPTFPALFLGAVGGLLAAHLPGFSETPAVAVLIGAGCVSILRLPLSSVVIALLLTSKAGLAVAPLIIVAVAVAYITTEVLAERRVSVAQTASAPGGEAAMAAAVPPVDIEQPSKTT
jgi:H+/Cl- antiporter ClcA